MQSRRLIHGLRSKVLNEVDINVVLLQNVTGCDLVKFQRRNASFMQYFSLNIAVFSKLFFAFIT